MKDVSSETDIQPDANLFATLMTHFCHQDALMWSRVQIILAIQAGALGGALSVTTGWLSVVLLIAAAILTVALVFMMLRDAAIRDVNGHLLTWLGYELAKKYIGQTVPPELLRHVGDDHADPTVKPYRLAPRPQWPAPFRAARLNVALSVLLAVVDIALAVIIAYFPRSISR
ncbi:MAG TPA: hypothetical protein VJZ00_21130 [Thermoanaerobaculia bacterium]|nr:hypothetical protein [Thermoanaerobaculia bacterium]